MNLLPLNAPEGYRWHDSPVVQTQVLVPDGWFVLEKDGDDFAMLSLSEDSPSEDGRFHLGLSIRLIRDFSQSRGIPPTHHARHGMAQIRAAEEIIFSKDVAQTPDTIQLFTMFRGWQPYPHTTHLMLMGDDSYDEFRWVAFTAPSASWHEAWNHGRRMFEHLLFWHPLDLAAPFEAFSQAIH